MLTFFVNKLFFLLLLLPKLAGHPLGLDMAEVGVLAQPREEGLLVESYSSQHSFEREIQSFLGLAGHLATKEQLRGLLVLPTGSLSFPSSRRLLSSLKWFL